MSYACLEAREPMCMLYFDVACNEMYSLCYQTLSFDGLLSLRGPNGRTKQCRSITCEESSKSTENV